MKHGMKVLVLAIAASLVAVGCRTATTGGDDSGIVLIGADGLLSNTYVSIEETQGMYFTGPTMAGRVEDYQTFLEKYRQKTGGGPIQSFHAHAYDATMILLNAVEKVAEQGDDGSLTIDRQELRDEMYATEGYQGLTGSLTCNKFGDCAQPAVSVYENEDPSEGLGGLFTNVVFTSSPPEGVEDKTGPDPQRRPNVPSATRTIRVAANDPIQLGVIQTISGATASLGDDQVTAIEIAIEDKGEIHGHRVRTQVEDGGCATEGGAQAAERMVGNRQIVGVVGTSCSGAARGAMPILQRNGYVMISGSNTSPGLTATGYLDDGDLQIGENWAYGYFRTAHNDEFQGQGSAQFVYEELGLRKAATIHDGDPYTQGLTSQFELFFERLGGEIVHSTSINKGDTDMSPVMTDIKARDPEVIYFPIFQPEGDHVVRAARDAFREE